MEREELNFLLQQVDDEELARLCQHIATETMVEVVQRPTFQTVQLPVQDPVNGGSFYGGEALVTSAIMKVNGICGWAMVLDENPDKAQHVALLDGAFAASIHKEVIVELACKGAEVLKKQQTAMNSQVNETRVSFDLM